MGCSRHDSEVETGNIWPGPLAKGKLWPAFHDGQLTRVGAAALHGMRMRESAAQCFRPRALIRKQLPPSLAHSHPMQHPKSFDLQKEWLRSSWSCRAPACNWTFSTAVQQSKRFIMLMDGHTHLISFPRWKHGLWHLMIWSLPQQCIPLRKVTVPAHPTDGQPLSLFCRNKGKLMGNHGVIGIGQLCSLIRP